MKTINKILSWVAFCVISIVIGLVSVYGGACVGNYLHDLLHLSGWECLLVAPVVLFSGCAIGWFFMLGLCRFGIQYNKSN